MKQTILCPKCNQDSELNRRKKTTDFRKESYEYYEHFYLCNSCKLEIIPDDLKELNNKQIYNQYRERHNIVFPEQINQLRKDYGINPVKMSRILGFGDSIYRSYEMGEVPSISNARILRLALDPHTFEDMVNDSQRTYESEVLSKLEYDEVSKIIRSKKDELKKERKIEDFIYETLKTEKKSTGYKRFNFKKFSNVVVYFLNYYGANYKTYINKFLFYSDFLNYKNHGESITGTRYLAIQRGPVPQYYDIFYDVMKLREYIRIEEREFEDGNETKIYERFVSNSDFAKELFTKNELTTLETTLHFFKQFDPMRKIVDKSHEEKAWKENVGEKEHINYQKYAFDLTL